jgi:hypothetical protein
MATNGIPSLCQSDCGTPSCSKGQALVNNSIADLATTEGQKVGKIQALCAINSTFATDYAICSDCLLNGTTTHPSTGSFIDPELQPYLDYCAVVASTSSIDSALSIGSLSAVSFAQPTDVSVAGVPTAEQTTVQSTFTKVITSSAAPTGSSAPSERFHFQTLLLH